MKEIRLHGRGGRRRMEFSNGCTAPIHITLLNNTASIMSGVCDIYQCRGRTDLNVVAIAGDGVTADCGFQSLSGAAERGRDRFYSSYGRFSLHTAEKACCLKASKTHVLMYNAPLIRGVNFFLYNNLKYRAWLSQLPLQHTAANLSNRDIPAQDCLYIASVRCVFRRRICSVIVQGKGAVLKIFSFKLIPV